MPPLSIQPWKPMPSRTFVVMPCRTLAIMKPMTRMMMAPMRAGKAPKIAPSPSDSDCVTACILAPSLWFACVPVRVLLWSILAGLGSLHSAQSASYERREQHEDAAHDGRDTQAVRDAGRDSLREARRHRAREDVREGRAEDAAGDRDDYRD